MKRATYIQQELDQIGTIEGMTGVFEAIASIHIAQIRDRVVSSTAFVHQLWQVYRQLRREGQALASGASQRRPALVVITSDAGLIGDIDQRIITAMLAHPGRENSDIYVIGNHGVALLAREGVRPLKVFRLPDSDDDINLDGLAALLRTYSHATVYYQQYVSLTRQEAGRLDLVAQVESLGATAATDGGLVISSHDYIFEPSQEEIVAYMESVMLTIALEQAVLESRLAQYASRFNAMSAAKSKAGEMQGVLRRQVNRAKRWQEDERIKEVISSLATVRRSG